MTIIQATVGLLVFVFLAYIFSIHKKSIDWRLVIAGVALQFVFGYLILKVPGVSDVFQYISTGFVNFLGFSQVGAEFIFGDLAKNSFADKGAKHNLGFIIAFQVLPVIIFFSTISAALYYLGVLQKVVQSIAWVMKRTMRLSGPESLSTAGNIFLGQTEAPLLVKPFIAKMTQSELMCLMTGGMATIAGSVMGAYVSFLGGSNLEEQALFASHLLGASIMSAPAAIVFSKILIPETEPDKIQTQLEIPKDNIGVNLIDAMSNGASDGLRLALNVGGMLLAFTAVVAMLNAGFFQFGEWVGWNKAILLHTGGAFQGFSLEYIFGQICRPLAFLMGVEWKDTLQMGSLIGQKTVINEFIAYQSLGDLKSKGLISDKTIMIATYALCGFANFSSIAIQIAGIGGMAPSRQGDLACFMTAGIAAIISELPDLK
jgi:concentrative nucleoside transporter, CNT family